MIWYEKRGLSLVVKRLVPVVAAEVPEVSGLIPGVSSFPPPSFFCFLIQGEV